MAFILFIFNLGYLFQHVGTIFQIKRIENKRDTEGVCVDTQILFLFGALARMIWIHDTMLKDYYLTYIELLLAFTSLLYTLYICLFKYNNGFPLSSILNNTSLPIFIRWYVILAVSVILSYFFFPGNEGQKFDVQMFVSLNIFAEAAGLLPQIACVNAQKDSNIFSSFYLMCLSVSRILRLFFWIKMYADDNSFLFLMCADILHLIMVSGFIYTFFKNLNSMTLPTDKSEDKANKMF